MLEAMAKVRLTNADSGSFEKSWHRFRADCRVWAARVSVAGLPKGSTLPRMPFTSAKEMLRVTAWSDVTDMVATLPLASCRQDHLLGVNASGLFSHSTEILMCHTQTSITRP